MFNRIKKTGWIFRTLQSPFKKDKNGLPTTTSNGRGGTILTMKQDTFAVTPQIHRPQYPFPTPSLICPPTTQQHQSPNKKRYSSRQTLHKYKLKHEDIKHMFQKDLECPLCCDNGFQVCCVGFAPVALFCKGY